MTVGTKIRMENFSVNTDGSGQVIIALTNTPESINGIMIYVNKALRIAEIASLASNNLTITMRKVGTKFNSADTIDASSIPAGVSISASSPITTSANSGSGVHPYPENYYLGPDNVFAPIPHTHTVSNIFQHKHDNTVATALGSDSADLLATSESAVSVTILYTSAS